MSPSDEDLGLYVHIPFCRRRCHFCAFYLEIARSDRMALFRSALAQEIALYRRQDLLDGRVFQSIYFGGGTPTSLPADQLVALLTLIRATWPTAGAAEITVEAHPSSVTVRDLTILADAGFNRISFGAESMADKDFVSIGRFGQVQDTAAAVQAARQAGFRNINLDLMYGLPGQSLQDWIGTLESLMTLAPSHISCYALTIEEDTRLAQDIARNLVPPPDEILQIDMESAAERFLAEEGFSRYEISNYAKPDSACRHNLLYWTGGEYLGLGPSAQSYLHGIRFGNVADLEAYAACLNDNRLPITERTILSASERQRDALVFGLRLLRGVPRKAIPAAERDHQIDELIAKGLLDADHDRVRLTSLGRRYADMVAEQLF
ncbi:MAG TPA: radical SAM family heme chaperone HemW [Nitrospira sp.]|nr:radical SAM family heme chaperone HemW [Nitrospira sp.]